jgi:hypothetical protein
MRCFNSPDLDDRIVDRLAVAVDDAALHGDRLAGCPGIGEILRDEPGKPDVQVRADGLRCSRLPAHVDLRQAGR